MVARIPDNVVDEVKARASIVDIVGEYVRLKRKGARYLGLCPFHNEKTPSFSVNAERNLYHCFGCGASGDVIGFLRQHDGLSFPEAVRKLADRLGIAVPESHEDDATARARAREKDRYFEATRYASEFFRRQLTTPSGKQARQYLADRGIDEQTAEAFELGFAPGEWGALVEAAGRSGISSKSLENAGLAMARNSGEGHYDRFRNRVVFPIVNLSRRVLAFSGRTLDPEERAKYINSPETPYYTKGRELFGLHVAHRSIREAGYAVLVEGNFDVVSLHARGLTNVCAALGTALTEQQARLVRRYSERVVLLFDADSAGRKAARKALDMLLAADVPDVRYCRLPDGTDPDDFVQSHGADALRELIEKAPSMLDVVLDETIRPVAGKADLAGKRRAIDEIAALLAPIPNTLIRDGYVAEAARRLELDGASLKRHVSRGGGRLAREPMPESPPELADEAPTEPDVVLDKHESVLLDALARRPALLETVYREQTHHLVGDERLQDFIEQVAVTWTLDGGPDVVAAAEALEPGPLRRALTGALVTEHAIADDRVDEVFADTTRTMKIRWMTAEMRRISERLRATQDPEAVELLMKRQSELNHWLNDLRRTANPAP